MNSKIYFSFYYPSSRNSGCKNNTENNTGNYQNSRQRTCQSPQMIMVLREGASTPLLLPAPRLHIYPPGPPRFLPLLMQKDLHPDVLCQLRCRQDTRDRICPSLPCPFSPAILLTGIEKYLGTYPQFKHSSGKMVHVKPLSTRSWRVKQRASNSRLGKKTKSKKQK